MEQIPETATPRPTVGEALEQTRLRLAVVAYMANASGCGGVADELQSAIRHVLWAQRLLSGSFAGEQVRRPEC